MFKKSLIVSCAISITLSLVGCGGSEVPGATEMPGSSLSGNLTPVTTTDSAISPVGDLSAGDAYDQTYEDPSAEGAEALPEEEIPAEEVPAEEPVAEETSGAAPGTMPEDMTVSEPYSPPASSSGSSATSYAAEGSFMVDQDTFNQWQAANISTDGINIYVLAVDNKMPAKGTVITMDSSGGTWTDIGKSLLATFSFGALGYKMDETVKGLAVDGSGNVAVADAEAQMYNLAAPKYSITKVEAAISGATDMAAAADGSFYVATSSGIQKVGSDLSSPTSFGSVSPTGGIATDSQGNLYAVAGSSIKKITSSGSATDAVKDISGALDVAVDGQGNIFVLGSSSVTWYNASGVKQGEFGGGELQAPVAICADSSGGVFVADAGTSHKDSAIFKYTASSGGGGLGESLGSLEDL